MAVKWKRLPFPGSLSTQIRPPISSTSSMVIASPRPVPPKRREVELSAWLKASKTSRCFSGGMPIPVSETSTCRVTLPSPSASGPTVTTTSPRSVNLMALVSRLRRICRSFSGSARTTCGSSGVSGAHPSWS